MLEYYRFKNVYDLFMKGLTEEARAELGELQQKYVEACQENITLKAQVQEYEDILFFARNLVFDGSFYWLITGSIKQGPFCPNCYNKDGLLIRITDVYPRRCSSCGEIYERGGGLGKGSSEQAMPRVLDQVAAVGVLRAFAGPEQRQTAKTLEFVPAQSRQKAKIIPLQQKRG